MLRSRNIRWLAHRLLSLILIGRSASTVAIEHSRAIRLRVCRAVFDDVGLGLTILFVAILVVSGTEFGRLSVTATVLLL